MKRLALLVALALAGAIIAPAAASAASAETLYQALATPNPEPQTGARWGERLAVANDENGDGVKDLFMATPFSDGSYPNQGRVYLLSGKDRSILRAIDSPEPQGGTAFGFSSTGGASFGFYISVPGDLNGDGKDDVVAGTDAQNVYTGSGPACGTPEPNGCNEGQGKAWAFSGATGAVLYGLNNPDPQGNARFGSRIGRAGDVTGDGVPDVIVGASSNDVPAGCGDLPGPPAGCHKNQGQAYIFNGATGGLFRTLDMPAADQSPSTCTSNCGTFGQAVQGPGDTNGDGVPDQLVDAGNYNAGQGREYVFSGADGSRLLSIDDPAPQPGAVFGFQDAAPLSPGDVNGDGAADIYANGFLQNGPDGRDGEGRAWVFDGRTGALLYPLTDPAPSVGGQFGWSLSRTDYNGDSTPDLYVGQSPHHVAGADEGGGTYVFDGRNGSLLKALELPAADGQPGATGNVGPALGWTNAAPGDLNGDGQPDYLAGAPFFDEGGHQDNGRIYTFMSGTPAAAATTSDQTQAPASTQTVVVPIKPARVKIAGITVRATPTRDRKLPYVFSITGRVRRPAGIGTSACKSGRISAQTKVGTKTISTRRATLRSDCTFRVRLVFSVRRRVGRGRLTVAVRFLGTSRFLPASAKRLTVRAG